MPTSSLDQPLAVPSGYGFRRELSGDRGFGFWGDDSQRTLIYTRSWRQTDTSHPLMIHITSRDSGPLIGTESKAGLELTVVDGKAPALYHDGLWIPASSGVGNGAAAKSGLRWDDSDVHSLTWTSSGIRLAVRGARSRGVSFGDLVRTLRSAAGLA